MIFFHSAVGPVLKARLWQRAEHQRVTRQEPVFSVCSCVRRGEEGRSQGRSQRRRGERAEKATKKGRGDNLSTEETPACVLLTQLHVDRMASPCVCVIFEWVFSFLVTLKNWSSAKCFLSEVKEHSESVAVLPLKRAEWVSAVPEALSPHLGGNCAAGMRALFSPELTQ